jgi:hypothetical protein
MKHGKLASRNLNVLPDTSGDCSIYFPTPDRSPLGEDDTNKPRLVWNPQIFNQEIRFPWHKSGTVVVEDKEYIVKLEDHFAFFTPSGNPSGTLGLKVVSNGGSAGTTLVTYPDRLGVVNLATGTTNTGRTCVHSQANTIQFAAMPMSLDIVAKIIDLPTTTEGFDLILGFGDSNSSAPSDGAYFFCSQANPNWLLQTRITGVLHSVDSGVAVNTDWHKFSVRVDKDPIRVSFWIDNTYVGEQPSSKTPKGNNQETAIQCYIQKSVGLTSRSVHMDRIFYGAFE